MSTSLTILSNIFKSCLNTLRDNEHLTGDKALRNLSYLLILKLLEPRFDHQINIDTFEYPFHLHFEGDQIIEKYKTKLLSIVRFSTMCQEKEDDIPSLIKLLWDVILSEHPATKHIFLKHKGFDIVNKSTFKTLLEHLSSIDLSNTEYDVLGEAYEDVIKDEMMGKVLGQYFTPPMVKNIMMELIQPKLKPNGTIEKIFDPAMGTGGFLISSLRHIMEQSQQQSISLDWAQISQEGLGGREVESDTYQLAVSNMLISSGLIFDGVEKGDSIRNPITNKYDVIMTNPPFGISGLKYDDFDSGIKSEYLPIKSNNAVSLFIQAIIYMLELNGRCAIVLPDGKDLFSKTDKTLMMVREYLMKSCDVKEIIYMPSGIFTHTSIKTCICYFEKKCTDCLTVDIKVSKSNKETRNYQFNTEHQTDKISFYEWSPEEKKLLTEADIKSISDNAYSLNYAEYMVEEEEEYEEDINSFKLSDICTFLPKSKRSAKFGESSGKYPFFTSSQLCTKYTDIADYDTECLIIGTGGTANVKYANMFSCSADNFVITFGESCHAKYVYYYLLHNISVLQKGFIGSGIQHISKEFLNNIQIPIPSVELQQDIVNYLDFIYEHTNKTSKEKIDELKKMNQYCIDNQKMFGKNQTKSLNEVCKMKSGNHSTKKSDFVDGDYLIIGGGKQPIGTHNEYNCDENTILCASVGSAGYISLYEQKTFITMAFALTEDSKMVDKMFLYYYLKSIEKDLIKLGKGTAQPYISMEKLKQINIEVPDLKRQQEIVEYCKQNILLIEELEKEIEKNEANAKEFINMILS